MFAYSKDTLLGISFAEIQRLMFGVIKATYDEKGIVKLTEQDKRDLVCHLISHIFEKKDSFKPERGATKSWMWRVAQNECSSYLRIEQDHICNHISIDANNRASASVNGILDSFTNYTTEELDALDAEVTKLPHTVQLILNLYCDNVREKDIALQLGMNYNTVRQTIRRTKELLKQRIKALVVIED